MPMKKRATSAANWHTSIRVLVEVPQTEELLPWRRVVVAPFAFALASALAPILFGTRDAARRPSGGLGKRGG